MPVAVSYSFGGSDPVGVVDPADVWDLAGSLDHMDGLNPAGQVPAKVSGPFGRLGPRD